MLPRGWLGDTAALYARVFRRGAELALKNWPIGLLVLPYAVLLQIALVLASPFGIVGGLLLYLLNVACAGAGLSLVEQVIRAGRVRLRDVPSSFAAYFWDLLTLGFVLWGFRLLGSMLPPGSLPWFVFQLA